MQTDKLFVCIYISETEMLLLMLMLQQKLHCKEQSQGNLICTW